MKQTYFDCLYFIIHTWILSVSDWQYIKCVYLVRFPSALFLTISLLLFQSIYFSPLFLFLHQLCSIFSQLIGSPLTQFRSVKCLIKIRFHHGQRKVSSHNKTLVNAAPPRTRTPTPHHLQDRRWRWNCSWTSKVENFVRIHVSENSLWPMSSVANLINILRS